MPDIDKLASGPSYSVVRLCESLIAQGLDTRLALIGDPARMRDKPFIQAFPAGMGPARLGRSPAMLRWLRQQTESGAVDIVHNHSLWMMPNVYPGWATRRSGVPLVVSPRGTLSEWAMQSGSRIKKVFWPLLQHPAIAHAACFHATADSEYEDIRRLGFRQPVMIVPNGIDLPAIRHKPPRARRRLLFLGRIHPKKGVDFLLRAWQQLEHRHPDWDLQIVGPDNIGYLDEMRELARKLALQRVEFPGELLGDAKLQAYLNADAFVLPTHSENFGMTVAEALACGTPAIVSRGAPWQGLDGQKAGWWIDIGYEPLLACLEQVLAMPQPALDAMGENGRAWVNECFSWTHIGHNMKAGYAWLLNQGEKPACMVTG